VFHLLQSVSLHSRDLDVGVPARGLASEGYHGHVFWGELLSEYGAELLLEVARFWASDARFDEERCDLGLTSCDGELDFDPLRPEGLNGISLCLHFRGSQLRVAADHHALRVALAADQHPCAIRVRGELRTLIPGQEHVFDLAREPSAPAQHVPATFPRARYSSSRCLTRCNSAVARTRPISMARVAKRCSSRSLPIPARSARLLPFERVPPPCGRASARTR